MTQGAVGGEEDVARFQSRCTTPPACTASRARATQDELEHGGRGQRTVDVEGLVEGYAGHGRGGQPGLFAGGVVVDHRHQVVPADLLGRPDLLLEPAPELWRRPRTRGGSP